MFKDYIRYSDKVMKILKRKQPDIKFDTSLIRTGFIKHYEPIILAEALIRIYNNTK